MKQDSKMYSNQRRRLLITAGSAALLHSASVFSKSPDYVMKLATTQDPTNPVNIRASQAIDRIRKASGGKLEIRLFPASQLGSDTDLLAQVRGGGVEFCIQAASILSTLVPQVGIANVGFAFKDYAQVWKAMDGSLGKYLQDEIQKTGMTVVSRPWDNGFRQITTSTRKITTPDDLKGLKLRVPPSPMITAVFQALGAGPTPININELYSSLQTHLVEGEENSLTVINASKIYEVQKFASLTSHVWDNHWLLANPDSFERLPPDLQKIVRTEFEQAVTEQRRDVAQLSVSLRSELSQKGLIFNDVDQQKFRDRLSASGFYKRSRERFGEAGWKLLESAVGSLA